LIRKLSSALAPAPLDLSASPIRPRFPRASEVVTRSGDTIETIAEALMQHVENKRRRSA